MEQQADYMLKIGRAIAQSRIKLGLTQADLAAKIGTSQSAINRIEHGKQNASLEIISKIGEALETPILVLNDNATQGYRIHGGKNYYVFFDLKDMLREAGASDGDLDALQSALDEAIVYEAHTSRFIDVKLNRCCGLSVYLPAYPDYRRDIYHGTEFLDGFYKENVAWNQATSLVE